VSTPKRSFSGGEEKGGISSGPQLGKKKFMPKRSAAQKRRRRGLSKKREKVAIRARKGNSLKEPPHHVRKGNFGYGKVYSIQAQRDGRID